MKQSENDIRPVRSFCKPINGKIHIGMICNTQMTPEYIPIEIRPVVSPDISEDEKLEKEIAESCESKDEIIKHLEEHISLIRQDRDFRQKDNIDQYNHIKRLEGTINFMEHQSNQVKSELSAAKTEVERLREALEWLADSYYVLGFKKEAQVYTCNTHSLDGQLDHELYFEASTPLEAIQAARKASPTY